jgi:hypothetical protein
VEPRKGEKTKKKKKKKKKKSNSWDNKVKTTGWGLDDQVSIPNRGRGTCLQSGQLGAYPASSSVSDTISPVVKRLQLEANIGCRVLLCVEVHISLQSVVLIFHNKNYRCNIKNIRIHNLYCFQNNIGVIKSRRV